MENNWKLPKKFMKKWTKALRSGNYDQGTGTLLDDGYFCCLGVACDIVGVPYDQISGEYIYDQAEERIPNILRGSADENKLVKKLAEMNDGTNPNRKQHDFNTIADWIDKNIKPS